MISRTGKSPTTSPRNIRESIYLQMFNELNPLSPNTCWIHGHNKVRQNKSITVNHCTACVLLLSCLLKTAAVRVWCCFRPKVCTSRNRPCNMCNVADKAALPNKVLKMTLPLNVGVILEWMFFSGFWYYRCDR